MATNTPPKTIWEKLEMTEKELHSKLRDCKTHPEAVSLILGGTQKSKPSMLFVKDINMDQERFNQISEKTGKFIEELLLSDDEKVHGFRTELRGERNGMFFVVENDRDDKYIGRKSR